MSIAEKFEKITDAVYEKGKKDEHAKFWDMVQKNGDRTYYYNGFIGTCYNFENFYPKHDINIVGSGQLFMYNWKNGMGQADKDNIFESLKKRLEECNVTLNTGGATNLSNAFSYGTFTELPAIDLRGLTDTPSNIFSNNYTYLQTIEKIIVDENTPFTSSMFTNDTGLVSLTVEGTIAKNGFNVKDCKNLSSASIVSIIEALSTETDGLTVTLSKTAVNNMTFPIVGNKGTYNSWTELEQTRTNWTISLV